MPRLVFVRKEIEEALECIKKVSARSEHSDMFWLDPGQDRSGLFTFNKIENLKVSINHVCGDEIDQDSICMKITDVLSFIKNLKCENIALDYTIGSDRVSLLMTDETANSEIRRHEIQRRGAAASAFAIPGEFSVPSEMLKAATSATKFSVDPQKNHAPICGLQWKFDQDNFSCYSTDQSCVTRFKVPISGPQKIYSCFIPSINFSVLENMPKIDALTVYPSERQIVLKSDDFCYVTQQEVNGSSFPDIDALIDVDPAIWMEIDRNDFLNRVKSINIVERTNIDMKFFADPSNPIIKFSGRTEDISFRHSISGNIVGLDDAASEYNIYVDLERIVRALRNVRQRVIRMGIVWSPTEPRHAMLGIKSGCFDHVIFPSVQGDDEE